MEKYTNYRNTLIFNLTEIYHLSKNDATHAVLNSSANQMLNDESSALWQMHEPLLSTVNEIYDEYKSHLLSV